jgi:hypothetical protein
MYFGFCVWSLVEEDKRNKKERRETKRKSNTRSN